jgi:ubiquinone/menaquinone biosynthesis C-methylase UbiE
MAMTRRQWLLNPGAFVVIALAIAPGVRAGGPVSHAAGPSVHPGPPAASHPPYVRHAIHDPDGIGIFYMGREIAQVMGHEAADWLDRPTRDQEEQPERMLGALKLKPGDRVADIGAGSGFMTFRLAKRVAPGGLVYAEDIQPEMMDIIRKRMVERQVQDVQPILGTIMDPKLPASSVDLILLVDVYHEFDHPYEMTRAMVHALKPGGRLVLVEYRLEDPTVPIKRVHKMSVAQVRREMSLFPLRFQQSIEILPLQHIIFFQRR